MNKVFGIGLSRTGTASLTAALSILGYRACHFPNNPMADAELYDALTDTPVAVHYRELAGKFPKAKFVLTVRDQRSWLDSCDTLWATQSARFSDDVHVLHSMLYGSRQFDRYRFAVRYMQHTNDVVRDLAHTGRLLVMNICDGQGWDLLCPFLHKKRPSVSFPHENDRMTLYTNEEWQHVYEPMKGKHAC